MGYVAVDSSAAAAAPRQNSPVAVEEATITLVGEMCRKLKILITTWNMGDTAPGDGSLAALFQPTKVSDYDWDIIAIGTQECNYKPSAGFANCEADWADRVLRAASVACPSANYVTLEVVSLRDSIRMVVLVKGDLRVHISKLKVNSYSTTVPLFWRKGAVGCSMTLFDFTTVCFINSHLAAHQESTAARNDECQQILRGLRLGNINYDAGNQFSHCFFFGDLNYRVDTTWHDAVAYLNRNELSYLRHRDQLLNEQRRGAALTQFQEPELISFPPTFKVKRGTTNAYDQKRTPSWCDRILWASLPDCASNISPLCYESNTRILSSDHLPVTSSMELTVPLLTAMIPLWPQKVFTFTLADVEIEMNPPTHNQPQQQQLLQLVSAAMSSNQTVEKMNPRLIVSGPVLALEPIKSLPVQNVRCDLEVPPLCISSLVSSQVTTSASWTELPTFSSKQVPQEKYMQYQHIFIAVYDYKYEGREELVAQAALGLRPHMGANVSFHLPLLYGGTKRGTIRGQLIVQ